MTRGATFAIAGAALAAVGIGVLAVTRKSTSKGPGGRTAAVGSDGVVRWDNGAGAAADPHELASAAGVGIDVYALARMTASEAGGELAKTACAWAAMNMARSRKVTISALLLKGKGIGDGVFSRQNLGKYASTQANPKALDLTVAARVFNRQVADPTGGATQFDAPSAQDKLLASGTKGYTKTADQVAAERLRGSELVMVPGLTTVRFWRPKTGVS